MDRELNDSIELSQKQLAQDIAPEEGKGNSEENDGKFGLFCFKPKWLQFFNTPIAFMSVLCFIVMLKGFAATGYIAVIISTIEIRYNLSSSLSAFALISYEIGAVFTIPFIAVFGSRIHKPRIIACFLLVFSLGSFIFTIPQFASPSYKVATSTANLTTLNELCKDPNDFTFPCHNPLISYYPLFVLGNFLIGVGSAAIDSLGTVFLDDNINPKYMPIYISTIFISAVIGPALGFVLGGIILSIYVDPWDQIPPGLTEESPSWVGAWWIGFLIASVLALILSFITFLYPSRLRGYREVDIIRKEEIVKTSFGIPFEFESTSSYSALIKDIPRQLLLLLKNPTFIFISLSIAAGEFIVDGIANFLPKYIETQFSVTSSTASYLVGGLTLPGVIIGTIIGAVILYFVKLTVKQLALYVFIITTMAVLLPPFFLIGCKDQQLAGISTFYPNTSSGLTIFRVESLNHSCFADCECESKIYHPICLDTVTYFSPCLAGCKSFNQTHHTCACDLNAQTISSSKCDIPECTYYLIGFSIGLVFGMIIIFMNDVPFFRLLVRCVADNQRALSIITSSFIVRLLGQIPGPLVFGAIFDANCIYWQETECGERGACLEYNNFTLRISAVAFILLGAAFTSLASGLGYFAWRTNKNLNNNQPNEEVNIIADNEDTTAAKPTLT